PAAHFPDLQFGCSTATVSPGHWNYRPTISTDDGLKRNLNRKIEMRRQERATTIDHFATVSFEGIGNVICFNAEEQANEPVGTTIDPEFQQRVVNDTTSSNETAAEDAIIAGVQCLPVAHDIPAVVRLVCH